MMCIILKGPVACFHIHVNKALKEDGGGGLPEMEVKYGKGKTKKGLKHL